jgi:hypothetical protein
MAGGNHMPFSENLHSERGGETGLIVLPGGCWNFLASIINSNGGN